MSSEAPVAVVRRSEPSDETRRPSPLLTFVSARRSAAYEEARALVGDARNASAALLARAREESIAIRETAQRDGRCKGESAWAAAAHALAESRSRALASLERDCVRLALEIARQIIGEAIRLDRTIIDAIARRTCAPLKREATLRLFVSESDTDRIESIRAGLAPDGPVSIAVDPALSPGDCTAECAGVRVDGTLAQQLEVIERRLLTAAGERRSS